MLLKSVRDYSKHGDGLSIPTLIEVQKTAYERFLQFHDDPEKRGRERGLEALLQEVFPIVSYDGQMKLEYICYKLDEPRYTPQECKELRLTFGMPFRIVI